MAKENLFNILQPQIRGARFLDLFCGSGAVGLEALSRGAKEAVFVENSKPAIAAAVQNIEKTRLSHSAQLMEMPVANAIDKLIANRRCFDIIFLDPPYETGLLAQTLDILAGTDLLAPGGTIIAETDAKWENATAVPSTLSLTDTRIYGRTCFLFYNRRQYDTSIPR